jgi:hypothetical protein
MKIKQLRQKIDQQLNELKGDEDIKTFWLLITDHKDGRQEVNHNTVVTKNETVTSSMLDAG